MQFVFFSAQIVFPENEKTLTLKFKDLKGGERFIPVYGFIRQGSPGAELHIKIIKDVFDKSEVNALVVSSGLLTVVDNDEFVIRVL